MAKQRIDKIFSNLGILSRSECKLAVKRGEIGIISSDNYKADEDFDNTAFDNEVFDNDDDKNARIKIVKSSDEKADPDLDKLFYKGQLLDTRSFVYYMLNKPAGYLTANEDKHTPTVFDLVGDTRTDLSAVGRLDKDTTGILLITNDGDINHRLLSPKFHVPKTYEVIADGSLTEEDIALLERGIDIGDEKPTLPAICKILDNNTPCKAELTITEGRFHQVKRMFEAIGKPVLKLHRKSFGPLLLDPKLPEGKIRTLSPEEEKLIFKAAGRL